MRMNLTQSCWLQWLFYFPMLGYVTTGTPELLLRHRMFHLIDDGTTQYHVSFDKSLVVVESIADGLVPPGTIQHHLIARVVTLSVLLFPEPKDI